MRFANLAIRFLLELAMLAALAYTGWELPSARLVSIALAVLLPLAAALTWGQWVAPKAKHRLADPARLFVEMALFAAAAGGLILAGEWVLGLALFAAYALNTALAFAWHQRAH